MSDHRAAWPGMGSRCITADVPGIGGTLRARPEDFLVEEQPLYEPRGEGEHVYLMVQKAGMSTAQAAAVLARHFGVPGHAVGYAGLKDKHAITRQVFSIHVPGKKPEDFPELRHERMAVLWADIHANKLRPGHLAGNRFSIKVRGVDMTAAVRAERTLRVLAARGVPNLAGEQRFGFRNNNHVLGRLDILGDAQGLLDELLGPDEASPGLNAEARAAYARRDFAAALELMPLDARVECAALRALARGAAPERAVGAIDATQRRFWITAFQSAVFNRVLGDRLEAGAYDRLIEGDLAWKHRNGAVFAVSQDTLADPDTAERLARLEISPSGPLWGASMMRAAGAVDAAENAALAASGVNLEALAAYAGRSRQPITGARRPLRVPVIDPEVEGGVDEHGHYVRCAFELPAGAFATIVMREVMKPAGSAAMDGDGARGRDSEAEEPGDITGS